MVRENKWAGVNAKRRPKAPVALQTQLFNQLNNERINDRQHLRGSQWFVECFRSSVRAY